LLLRNDQALGHHWLRLRLVGRAPNTGALGARVTLGAGGQTQRRLLMPSRSYLSAVDLPLSFGLGEAEAVDSLEVIWPDGTSQSVPVPGVDREIVVEQGG
ncbi:MAG: ASPIC/UnbV domain-containing protein, partial [Chloroflexi bacterium]|nr:ASPIC/UnbV domain-containing protein [Chloroflexota bacterium]